MFHFIPFLINKNLFIKILNFFKKNILAILAFLVLNIIFFDYSMQYTGGGIFFQISNYLAKNNFIFYFFLFFVYWTDLVLFRKKNFNNLLIFIILIASNIQNTIYHKYYDPLIMILLFTLINTELSKAFFWKKNQCYLSIYFLLNFYFYENLKILYT